LTHTDTQTGRRTDKQVPVSMGGLLAYLLYLGSTGSGVT